MTVIPHKLTGKCLSRMSIFKCSWYVSYTGSMKYCCNWIVIISNAGSLSIRPSGTNFNEILITSLTISYTKIRFELSSARLQPFCLGLNVLKFMPQMVVQQLICNAGTDTQMYLAYTSKTIVLVMSLTNWCDLMPNVTQHITGKGMINH